MPVLIDRFQVQAPLEAVSFFHQGTHTLRRLTPPPVIVQLHQVEPLGNGSQSAFTLWFGPLPIHWLAVHSNVNPQRGFTDTQARGPMKFWQHQHQWKAVGACTTQMEERVTYEYPTGWRGILSRVLFARPFLKMMFAYRRWAMRRALENQPCNPKEA